MLPDNELSTNSVYASFMVPTRVDPLIDYEWGGNDLNDESGGIQSKLWTGYYENGVIKIKAEGVQHDLLAVAGVTALSFAFDLNMRPAVTYIVADVVYLWWFDTSSGSYTTTNFGSEIITPQLSFDDHRELFSLNSDIIFAYIKNGRLCIRIQRDRYQVEYDLGAGQALIQIGMMRNYRFGFATKLLNGYDLFLDLSYVDARNKTLPFDYLDLCPLQSSYSSQFGNNVIKNDGLNSDILRMQYENIENTVTTNFNLNKLDFDYFMSFFRVWQQKRKPFFISLVLDQRPLIEYKVHFVADSVSMSKDGDIFKVSAQLHLLNNQLDKEQIKSLVESRNGRA
ncbi:hypothetical protein [Acinetobacter courvalinii]|uniref:hypothetical protein n=1 Tax=Acinetobacter courvalinii TaxID=280147 RepID=UPI0028A1E7E8|nr:hypothetical protein [Acinetobacter courvalinii]